MDTEEMRDALSRGMSYDAIANRAGVSDYKVRRCLEGVTIPKHPVGANDNRHTVVIPRNYGWSGGVKNFAVSLPSVSA